MRTTLITGTFLPVLSVVSCYKILCIFPIPYQSHHYLAKGVVNALLKAGHEITWVSPYAPKEEEKNLNIIPSGTANLANYDMTDPKYAKSHGFVLGLAKAVARTTVQNELVRKTLVNEQFDAVVTKWFFSKLYAGFAAVQRAPWVILNGVVYNSILEEIVDEVRSISTIPVILNEAPVPMNLFERITNTVFYLAMTFQEWMESAAVTAEYESLFAPLASARGVPLPPLSAVEHNVSILLVNSHPSFAPPHVMPSNVIQVAGYHIAEEVPPLPEDLQTILDNSPQGVVYFCMGSIVKSSNFPERTLKEVKNILGELPYTVLWKFEKELGGLPKNVHVRPWMPQPSILAHPNVKLFITHGGFLSTLEALHFGVPLLAIPVFGDQPSNAARATHSGYAKTVPFSPGMGPHLKKVLNELLTDDTTFKRAKFLSRLFRNREVVPSKLISHYVEVAIESQGAYHLRSPSYLYAWYERWMLDQLAMLLAVLYVMIKLVKKLFPFCLREKKFSKKKKN